jgi:hypothetical protein
MRAARVKHLHLSSLQASVLGAAVSFEQDRPSGILFKSPTARSMWAGRRTVAVSGGLPRDVGGIHREDGGERGARGEGWLDRRGGGGGVGGWPRGSEVIGTYRSNSYARSRARVPWLKPVTYSVVLPRDMVDEGE